MATRQAPRDRLIDTAAELFYDRGLPNVGINEVTDRAGVARMTLYNNFASKEALALAAFERQAGLRRVLVEKHLKRSQTPSESVKAMFSVAEKLATQPRFKGCAFINVAVQEPQPKGRMHALVRAHKDWIRANFRNIAESAGHKQPETAAQQLLALWDGAIVEAFIQGSVEPIRASSLAAAMLLTVKD
jgi:AcrR family transcriptional regulator